MQGVNQAAQPLLVQAMGHAAGRYGHVMYPENVHEPALEVGVFVQAFPASNF